MFNYESIKRYIPNFEVEFMEITDNEKGFKSLCEYIYLGKRDARYGLLGAFEHQFVNSNIETLRENAKGSYLYTAALARSAIASIAGAFRTEGLVEELGDIDFSNFEEASKMLEDIPSLLDEEVKALSDTINAAKQVEADYMDHTQPEGEAASGIPVATIEGDGGEGPIMASQPGSNKGRKVKGSSDSGFAKLTKAGYSVFHAIENSKYIKEVIDYMGRLEVSIVEKELQEEQSARSSYTGQDIGNDLSRMQPIEYHNFKQDIDRFAQRSSNGELLLEELDEENTLDRGHLFICVDRSGSMYADGIIQWSEGVCAALVRAFQRRKAGRRCWVVPFASKAVAIEATNMNFFDILKALQTIGRGRTSVSKTIDKVIDTVDREGLEDVSDILFLTDAEENANSRPYSYYQNALNQRGVSLYTACLSKNGRYNSSGILKMASNGFEVANVTKDRGKRNVEDMFARIMTTPKEGVNTSPDDYWC